VRRRVSSFGMDLRSPTTLLAAWVLVPALVAAVAAGLGGGVAVVAGQRLGALTLPAGFAALIALVTFGVEVQITGTVSVLLVLTLAIAGAIAWLLRRRRRSGAEATRVAYPRTTRYAAAGAGLTYALAMAPLVGTGRSGVLGYTLNNDTAVHLSAIELLRRHGTALIPINLSSFDWVGTLTAGGYPLGSESPFLLGRVLSGVDVLHLWVPLTALAAAMTSLVAFDLLRPYMAVPLAAIGGLVAASGYLPFSYLAQGGAKEVLIAFTVYASVALFVRGARDGLTWRRGIPVGVGLGAALANLGLGSLAWLGPTGLIAAAALLWRPGAAESRRAVLLGIVSAAVVGVLLALPDLTVSAQFVRTSTRGLVDQNQVGNLLGPVPVKEAFNVWFGSDYRYPQPLDRTVTYALIVLSAVLAAAGVIHALVRRRFGVPLAVLAGIFGVIIVTPRYAIYYDAKAYMALGPALAMATAVGVAAVFRTSIRNQGLALAAGALLVGGALWSDFWVYRGVSNSPGQRFEELATIDHRFAGRGPILVNERDDFDKYLLRHVRPFDSWGSWTPERGLVETATYNPRLVTGHTPDFDDYVLRFVERFPLLLERRRPGGSRPPANFRVIYETVHYRVWRRTGPAPRDHVGLGSRSVSGSARLDCRQPAVRAFLHSVRQHRRTMTVAVPPPGLTVVVPALWTKFRTIAPGPAANLLVQLGGSAVFGPRVSAGRYALFLRGSYGVGDSVVVDGRTTGATSDELSLYDAWQPVGRVDLPAGPVDGHVIGLGRRSWYPGSRRANITGALAFQPLDAPTRLVRLTSGRERAMCGRRVDWIEAGA